MNTPVRWALACAFVVAALAGCTPGGHDSQGKVGPKAAIVSVAPVTEQESPDSEDFTGRTEAAEMVEVKARSTGYLKEVVFDVPDEKAKDGKPGKNGAGRLVKKGDPLYLIDDRTYAADLKKAEAELVRDQALAERLKADMARARRLRVGDAISREDYDKISANLDEATASVESAKAAASRKKLDLEFCTVTAPISGRISRTRVTAGNLVTADVTRLTTIVSVSPIYAYFDVDERTVLRIQQLIREGKFQSAREAKVPVSLGTQVEAGLPHQGFIDFVDNRIDPSTGTLRVRGTFENTDEALTPGLFVRVRVPIGVTRKRVMVPDSILGNEQGQRYVYTVNDKNEVERRDVEVGSLRDGMRPVEKGLKPGERVIVNGMQRVRPGVPVDPKDAKMPSR